jgi:hypothetical protein
VWRALEYRIHGYHGMIHPVRAVFGCGLPEDYPGYEALSEYTRKFGEEPARGFVRWERFLAAEDGRRWLADCGSNTYPHYIHPLAPIAPWTDQITRSSQGVYGRHVSRDVVWAVPAERVLAEVPRVRVAVPSLLRGRPIAFHRFEGSETIYFGPVLDQRYNLRNPTVLAIEPLGLYGDRLVYREGGAFAASAFSALDYPELGEEGDFDVVYADVPRVDRRWLDKSVQAIQTLGADGLAEVLARLPAGDWNTAFGFESWEIGGLRFVRNRVNVVRDGVETPLWWYSGAWNAQVSEHTGIPVVRFDLLDHGIGAPTENVADDGVYVAATSLLREDEGLHSVREIALKIASEALYARKSGDDWVVGWRAGGENTVTVEWDGGMNSCGEGDVWATVTIKEHSPPP